jgi:hypothetical protein
VMWCDVLLFNTRLRFCCCYNFNPVIHIKTLHFSLTRWIRVVLWAFSISLFFCKQKS